MSYNVTCPWKPTQLTQLRARPSGTNPGNALKTLSVLFSIQTSLAVKSPHLSLTEATKNHLLNHVERSLVERVNTLWHLAIVGLI